MKSEKEWNNIQIVRDKQFSEKKEYIEMRERYKWRVIDVQDLGKHVGAHIQTNAAILSGNQGFLFFIESRINPVPGEHSSYPPHVWQEMKSQSGTGARTHLIERKPRCEFLSRLYLDTTIFPGIIPWFGQNLKNINISDTNGDWGLNPNWKRGRDQIKKDWKIF